ncbi:MAG: hypothetical protein CL955_01205 [Erythrobacteraceae bacterium]|nr:hypothetical protein [Erythrobacteraceae bacterium]
MAARAESRKGRGQLSSIDQLPEEADEDIVWVHQRLRERKLPQNVILMEFNERLADKGLGPISKSAFNRYAVSKAILYREQDRARRLAQDLVSVIELDEADDLTIMLNEMIKVASFTILERGDVDTKDLVNISRAMNEAEKSKKTSGEDLQRRQKRREAAADKVSEAAKEAGLSAETISQLRRDFLGVRESKSE